MTNTNEIIQFLSYVSVEGADKPNLANLLEIENVALPLAFAVEYGFAELTDSGLSHITEVYDFLVALANERGLDDIYDIVYTDTPITPRKMTVRVDI